MHVAHGARDLRGGDLQNLAELGHVQIAALPDLDLGIAALRDQRRQPSDLQLQSDDHQQVGLAEIQQEAGLGLDEVGVLIALGDGIDSDVVAADSRGRAPPNPGWP